MKKIKYIITAITKEGIVSEWKWGGRTNKRLKTIQFNFPDKNVLKRGKYLFLFGKWRFIVFPKFLWRFI